MEQKWKRGLPPGDDVQQLVIDYEVYFSPGGWKWHRRRTDEEKAEYLRRRAMAADPAQPRADVTPAA